MEQLINVQGMTCLNCQKTVKEKLEAIDGIDTIEVNFEKANAQFQTSNPLPIEQIAKQIGPKYTVSDAGSGITANFDKNNKHMSKWKALTPLWLIFSYLIFATLFLQQFRTTLEMAMYDFMGLFFIVFSFFKFLDLKGFPDSFAQYDPLARKSRLYGQIYPFIETLLGILFLLQKALLFSLLTTVLLLSITTYGVMKSLMNRNNITCACLGTTLKLPMTEATLIENILMITMALVGLVGFWL